MQACDMSNLRKIAGPTLYNKIVRKFRKKVCSNEKFWQFLPHFANNIKQMRGDPQKIALGTKFLNLTSLF